MLPDSIVVLIFKNAPIPLLPEYTSHIDRIQLATLVIPDRLYSMMRTNRTKTDVNKSASCGGKLTSWFQKY